MKIVLVSLNKSGSEDMLPLGLVTLATYLKAYLDPRIDVDILDGNREEDVLSKVISVNPDIIGLSAMTINYSDVIEFAKKIKSKIKTHILVGGVHISTLPNCLDKVFDAGVIGEAEKTFFELINHYKKYKNLKNIDKINGIAFFKNDKLIFTPRRELIQNLDEIPIPDRSLVDTDYYFREGLVPNGEIKIRTSVLTSRGCPFVCNFCSTSYFWQITRFNSAERVVEEIQYLNREFGVNHINLWDDLFTINTSRIESIIKELDEVGLLGEISFSCQGRTDIFNEELCKLLKRLNVLDIGFGFESGNTRVLNFLKKGRIKLEDHHRAILLCEKYGFSLSGSLIFGAPTETIEEMKDTLKLIDFMIEHNAENIWSFVMTPFPGTEIWQIAKERGKVNEEKMDWKLLSHQNLENPLLLDENIDREEFKKVFLEGRKKLTYFRRKKIKRDIS